MTDKGSTDSIFGAAVLKLSFMMKGVFDDPGFRVVYFGTLKELDVTDSKVNSYIKKNRDSLEAHIREGKTAY